MNNHTVDRFMSKIEKTDYCWNWIGTVNKSKHMGYGVFWLNNKSVAAHRVAYKIYIGDIPYDLQVDHLCRNRLCVNPDHLEAVTAKVNILRGNGLAAVNAKKTHCINGHEFTPENSMPRPGGKDCRECKRKRYRNWYNTNILKQEAL